MFARIKNILKKILPPPVKTFLREVNVINGVTKQQSEEVKKQIQQLLKKTEELESTLNTQKKQYASLETDMKNLLEQHAARQETQIKAILDQYAKNANNDALLQKDRYLDLAVMLKKQDYQIAQMSEKQREQGKQLICQQELTNALLVRTDTQQEQRAQMADESRRAGAELKQALSLVEQKTSTFEAEIKQLQQTLRNLDQTTKSNTVGTNSKIERLRGDMSRTKRENSMLISRTVPRNFIEHLDYHLVDHCNLNCKCCSTYAPIAKEHFADPQSFGRDLARLHELVGDSVMQIHLLGGEPLLHPQIEEFACIGRENFPHARIDFTTNGTLVKNMPESLWTTMKKYNIALKYTQYPIGINYEEMVEYVQKRGVYVFSAGGKDPIKNFRRTPLNTKGTFNAWNSYLHCPYTDCAQLRDGKLYHCPVPVFHELLNECMEKDGLDGKFRLSAMDYIDLYQATSGEEIMIFMSNAQPFCQYCDMNQTTDVEWEVSSRNIREWIDG